MIEDQLRIIGELYGSGEDDALAAAFAALRETAAANPEATIGFVRSLDPL